MDEIQHPFRNATLRVFQEIDGEDFIGRFYPYDIYPIFFHAQSVCEVTEKAEQFRADAIAKYEKAFIDRQKANERKGKRK